jgi:hypothetical protein
MADLAGRLVGVMIMAILLCSIRPLHGQDERRLQYRSSQEAASIMPGLSAYDARATAQRPADVPMAEFKDRMSLFAKWTTPMVKAGLLRLALDRSTAKEKPVTFPQVASLRSSTSKIMV